MKLRSSADLLLSATTPTQRRPSMTYHPRPIDTSHVVLSPQISELTELLAENAHDQWADQRFRDGWTFGPKRDDAAKQHPCLVPYAELPDAEKHYDRIMAL